MTLALAQDLDRLQSDATESWKSFDVATVNGNAVRFRVMKDATAKWHVHARSDELFYVVSGTVFMDTAEGMREICSGQVFVVPAGTRHRARVEGRASMLVIDAIG